MSHLTGISMIISASLLSKWTSFNTEMLGIILIIGIMVFILDFGYNAMSWCVDEIAKRYKKGGKKNGRRNK